MQQNNRSKKKSPSWVTGVVIALFLIFSAAGEDLGDIFYVIIGLIAFAIPIGILVVIFLSVKKVMKPTNHTHDRIDHRSDLKINPETGKTQRAPIRNVQPHSPQEHWKQQLDGLLANGTIDREEYRAMLNQKF